MSASLYLQQTKQLPQYHLCTTFVGFRVVKSIKYMGNFIETTSLKSQFVGSDSQ